MTKIISGVYEIRNIVNGHRYIGSSVNIPKRWNEHKRDLSGSKHHSIYLQRAWTAYGKDVFSFSVIEHCKNILLVEREQFYMNILHPEYNISPTAGNLLGVKLSDEHKKKLSIAGKGRIFSEEHKRKIGAAHNGKFVSAVTRAKIGAKSKGRIFSEESRRKMSESGKGKHNGCGWHPTDEQRQKISKSLLGNKRCVGRIPWNKGKKGLQIMSEEARRKMSESRTGMICSEEMRKKMSEIKTKWWAEKHANSSAI